ncbi:MAG: LysR family transcriptional regulator [Eubacterium sp.]|nr:LysR family transcriptional regulator [Eubacterium sp.]
MDIRYLNYFLEIAKNKNLSRASTYLFVSQSSLSQFLAKEEAELGVKLFIRGKKEMKLTYAGELYKKACEEMIATRDELYRNLSSLAQSKTGVTRLGITPQWGGIVYSKILSDYQKKYPLNKIILTEDIAHPLLESISENTLDMALLALNEDEPPQSPIIPIAQEELLLAVPTSLFTNGVDKPIQKHLHEIRSSGEIRMVSLSAFREEPFILSKERTIIRDITNRMFRSAGFTPSILCEINNHPASLEMVSKGLGITILPASYVKNDPNITYCSVNPHWYWNISIITRRDYVLNQSDQYLLSLIRNYYSKRDNLKPFLKISAEDFKE